MNYKMSFGKAADVSRLFSNCILRGAVYMAEFTFGQKLKLIAGSVIIVAAVYLGLKYLFPIVSPFIIAYLVALLIEKPVKWLAKRLGGRKYLASGIVVFLLVVVIGGALGYLIYMGLGEIKHFIRDYDYYVVFARKSASDICGNIDVWLGFEKGSSFKFLCDCTEQLAGSLQNGNSGQMMGKVVSVSLPVIVNVVKVVGAVIVSVMSVVYLSGLLDKIRLWRQKTVFSKEVLVVTDSLKKLVNVYFKVQAFILIINIVVCTVGLFIMRNPYAVVIGVLIGVVDALPIFGSGTILIPWALFMLLSGKVYEAAILITMYIITYFVREIMESKCMGERMGIAPFTMLMVIFVGLMIYGIMGFILGPVSYCIIKALILYLKTVIERGRICD